jgi:hypothetical protein
MLELWLRLAALHIEDPVESGSIETRIRDQWLLASRGYFTGCVPIGLDEDVATPEGKKVVVDAIQSLLAALKKAPPTVDGNTLNLLGIDGFAGNPETWRLIEVGQAFLDLIDGKITTTAGDDAPMPGYR